MRSTPSQTILLRIALWQPKRWSNASMTASINWHNFPLSDGLDEYLELAS